MFLNLVQKNVSHEKVWLWHSDYNLVQKNVCHEDVWLWHSNYKCLRDIKIQLVPICALIKEDSVKQLVTQDFNIVMETDCLSWKHLATSI